LFNGQGLLPSRLDFIRYIQLIGYMEESITLAAFGALSQPTRLSTFRLLVGHEPHGLPAGEIARLIDVPQNTMSAHLAILARAGLVRGERHSRSIIYHAQIDAVRSLVLFLLKDCCNGRADLCAPVIEALTPCCPPTKEPAHGSTRL
jgi:DNA-binding transcriptional ArsR family regulator